ncbi:TIGR03862 family flavoprotein [Luteimonas sp. MC1750]|uniref:TIGR03862 family flavoprotein n=1 Tax=Luteimonas sp. MC1750 TaxID=2799326 RepID=UPI0018F0D238|nr:TIGR03862 family flavoprotein [Luteimonas sp. MC1750]MBJ6984444.1 TIGR03862 family flavoprotein [Luteimonas sp. MC1750]QQO04941.1 TIGR03862 family flavoprotein [Luteimonas sp. MC1750]
MDAASALDMAPAPGRRVAVVGGGPAGLFAAERLRAAGCEVHVFEAKGSVGRKFLVAGKGGLNLTHSDPPALFASRYRERAGEVAGWLDAFDADALRAWALGLGVETFVGSSGRVFPRDLKAAPLLRGWVRRLRAEGVQLHVHHRWTGWTDGGGLRFEAPGGERIFEADATVLALGGGSWPELGSDGAWQDLLRKAGIDLAPLRPANCGFDVDWSAHFAQRHAGAPLKPVIAHWRETDDSLHALQGECVVSAHGIEGSLVYAISAALRDRIEREGHAVVELDLAPGRDNARLRGELARPRGKRSLSEHLRRAAGLDGVKAGLLREVLGADALHDPQAVAAAAKRLPLRLRAPRPIAEAISSAGGVRLEALDAELMLRARPGTFAAGEMLDWEAPTGGYLLTACFASGHVAAGGVLRWLSRA